MTIEHAIRLLINQYEADKKNKNIYNPVAHALYEVWRIADNEKRENTHEL